MDYKSKYLVLKNKQKGGFNFNIFNHANQPSIQKPPLPPTPHPDILASNCGICGNRISGDDIVDVNINAYFLFNCGHKFHYGCCGKWCAQKWKDGKTCSCPLCRYEQNSSVKLIQW